jgi:hypothetical protein
MITMNGNRTRIGWALWVHWVVASCLGGLVSLAGAVLLVDAGIYDRLGPSAAVVLSGLSGAAIGLMQWLVLRQYIAQAGWWVGATAFGFALGTAGASLYLAGYSGGPTGGQLWVLAGSSGAVVGGLQWLVLRRQIAHAAWWIPTSCVAYLLSGGLGGGGVVEALGSGAAAAALTGVVLLWLLRASMAEVARGLTQDKPPPRP